MLACAIFGAPVSNASAQINALARRWLYDKGGLAICRSTPCDKSFVHTIKLNFVHTKLNLKPVIWEFSGLRYDIYGFGSSQDYEHPKEKPNWAIRPLWLPSQLNAKPPSKKTKQQCSSSTKACSLLLLVQSKRYLYSYIHYMKIAL